MSAPEHDGPTITMLDQPDDTYIPIDLTWETPNNHDGLPDGVIINDVRYIRESRWHTDLTALRAQVETLREALEGLRDCIQETRGKNAHDAVEAADAALLLATLKAVEAQK